MKLLVIGGGGREHAIIKCILKSPKVSKVYCAPGNGGISELAECVDISATDIISLLNFSKEQGIDFTIVGSDDPLAMGIVDEFEKEGLKIFGPAKEAAIIEWSKAFSKQLMKDYNIPTASYEIFDRYEEALAYAKVQKFPLVIKADGLALGKGVIICNDIKEAEIAINQIMIEKKFGASGNKIVIEEFLAGPEVSVLSFCDGKTIVPMVSAQDHKRALDGNRGKNTGGMGTFSPSMHYTEKVSQQCMETIFKPTVEALYKEGRTFKGVIFFGLMLTEQGPKVIEYNARFGDPETQVVLPRLKSDLLEIMMACTDGTLSEKNIEWYEHEAVCVIAASGGYPDGYEKGYIIEGIDKLKTDSSLYVYHAGTAKEGDSYVTNGGRVLGVAGIGSNLEEAAEKAYEGISRISFKDMHYRRDIGR